MSHLHYIPEKAAFFCLPDFQQRLATYWQGAKLVVAGLFPTTTTTNHIYLYI